MPRDRTVVERFAEFGSTVEPMTSAEFNAYLEKEDAKWVPVIERAGIKLE